MKMLCRTQRGFRSVPEGALNRRRNASGLILLALAAAAVAACNRGIPVPPRTHPDVSAWTDLFAPDLSNAEAPAGVWSFEHGVLTATEDQNIWTKDSYADCIVDIEFKTDTGTNSGIIVYCSDTGDWIPNSVEIQIADDFSETWASSPATWRCGAVFGHLAPFKSAVKKPGEWNRATITCKGPNVWVMLNGESVTALDMTRWTSAKTNPDGSEIPPWLSKPLAELPTKGRIGLQGKHAGAPIYFRNLKVLRLD